jgi:hypothetical protein
MKRQSAMAFAASVTLLASAGTTAIAQTNLLVDLGDGPGVGINNSGQVALVHSLYNNGTLTPYPTGNDGVSVVAFTGAAINASGQVAGRVGNHAGLYSNGVVTDIVNGDPLTSSLTIGINDSGTMVGVAEHPNTSLTDGVIYGSGTYTSIGLLCQVCSTGKVPESSARAINNDGIVTGYAWQDLVSVDGLSIALGPHALRYDHGTLTDLFPGVGYAINASGQIAGRKDDISSVDQNMQTLGHAFIYTAGTTVDLGVLVGDSISMGYALNAAGQVVGVSVVGASGGACWLDFCSADSNATRAFFYNGAMNDLNQFVVANDPLKPFVTLTEARGINDNRLIVANGVDSRTGLTHAYLLQAPWLDVAPGNLVFPSQPDGSVSSQQSVSLTNSGTAQLALDSISTSGDFIQTSNCGAVLAPSTGCTAMVAFKSTALGNRTGSLTVLTNGAAIIIPLSGVASIKLSISSSATATTTGTPVTLTWTASSGVTCSATGGSTADSWTGVIAASGTQAVIETGAGTYLYGLTCTAGSQTAKAQVSVVVNLAPAPTPTVSGGGGAFDIISLLSLAAATGCRGTRQRRTGRRSARLARR